MHTDRKIWLKNSDSIFASGRIKLLEKIDETGSISKAATAVGISYKAAWDAIDKMNNLAEKPLVIKVTGGRSGGGSKLTTHARRLIATFYELTERQDQSFASPLHPGSEGIGFVHASTKNLFRGQVISIVSGEVNATVGVRLRGDDALAAMISRDSVKRMQLKPGEKVYALVNESAVALIKGDARQLAISARNRLFGRVSRINTAGVSAEVEIGLPGGQAIYTTMTADSVDSMDLKENDPVTALFKAQSVLLLK